LDITWLGHSCFRIRGREATVVANPCPPSTGYNIGKPTADIVTISDTDEGNKYVRAIAGKPVIISNPGEYEIHEAFITGISTKGGAPDDPEPSRNLVFIVEMEGLKVCHLGSLGRSPTAEQAEEMTGVDVLLIPVGGDDTIDGAKAAEIASLLEARIVIPMHFKTDVSKGQLDPPDRFLKELGASAGEPQPKLSVSRSTVPSETKVILLDYKR
jgi:L-ascorbate metabolism protein UlaG (beta-lactamase superfamily)